MDIVVLNIKLKSYNVFAWHQVTLLSMLRVLIDIFVSQEIAVALHSCQIKSMQYLLT